MNKNANNPVLVPGNPGSWDETTAVATTVLFHEGIYKMWYEGFDGGNLASGIYLYKLTASGGASNFTETKKLILLK